MKELLLYFIPSLEEYTLITEMIDNVEYLVVPAVMMVEGVHHGNQGAVLHEVAELEACADKWAGKPVTVHHPKVDGVFVPAGTEGVMETYTVGFVRSASMVDGKLKGEVCVNKQRLLAVSPETLTMLEEKKTLEVSIGIKAERIVEQGIWNNQVYTSISKNYQPDHLALLPDETGACSVAKGCGIRVNSEGGENVKVDSQFMKGFISMELVTNQDGFQETVEKVWQKLNSLDNDSKSFYLVDVFDAHVVYRMRNKVDDSTVMFKQTYQINDDGSIDLTGDAQKVRRDVNYIEVNVNKEGKVIIKTNDSMCKKCKERATDLILHAGTHFTEEDRVWLETLTEDKLDLLVPKVVRQRPAEVTVDKAWEVIQANAKELKDYVDHLPADVQLQVNKGIEVYTKERTDIEEVILTNAEEGTWVKEDLADMKLETLKKIAKSLVTEEEDDKTEVYAGLGGGKAPKGKAMKIAPMPIPGVEFKTAKE